jgi:hypothetical protein
MLEEIQREYLEDWRQRVTPAHYRNVELRLTRTLAALGARRVSVLPPNAPGQLPEQVRTDACGKGNVDHDSGQVKP